MAISLILLAKAYAAIGALVAVAFVFAGIDRVDPAARNSWAFRPLLVPGVILIWPLVVLRWIALERERA